jgi:hypothetical protein
MMNAEEKYEDDIRVLLEEAGLDSVPIDPVSLAALRELVAASSSSSEDEVHHQGSSNSNKLPSRSLRHHVEADFVAMPGASAVEQKVLELLHTQTQLLISMQQRIDELTTKVDQLTTAAPSTTTASMRFRPTTPAPATTTRTTSTTKQVTATAAPAPAVGVQPNNNNNDPVAQPMTVTARLVHMMVLFSGLRRRHNVQELDGGLIFKILFMMAILTARMSGHASNKKEGGNHHHHAWQFKFAILVVIVLLGFLMQTGYLNYCYLFFVKERYPQRIWNGTMSVEEIQNLTRDNNNINNNHNNAQQPQQQARQQQAQQQQQQQQEPQQQQQGWRNTFLGGLIPEVDPEQPGGRVLGLLQDVALLLGSFVMSIFPMWHPEGPRRQNIIVAEAAAQQQHPHHHNPGEQQQQQQDGMIMPGAVRPPPDVLQAAEDDDDNDNDDDDNFDDPRGDNNNT